MKVKLDNVFQELRNTKNISISVPMGSITPRTTTNKIKHEIKDIVQIKTDFDLAIKVKTDEKIKDLKQQFYIAKSEVEELDNLLQQCGNNTRLAKIVTLITRSKNEADTAVGLLKGSIQQIDEAVSKGTQSDYDSGGGVVFETIYQEGIENASQLSDQLPAALHYGINPELLGNLVGAYLTKQDVHPIEISLFKEAFLYLDQTESAESFISNANPTSLYPNNAVLIDIFVRDESSRIKEYGDTKQPETHTIVLWRKKNNEYLLIDPSQKSYSENFAVNMKNYISKNLTLPSNEKLYGTANYSPNDKPGYTNNPNNPLPRDCVDIAAKISLELNEQQKLKTQLQSIEGNMLKQISNVSKNAPHLAKFPNAIIRELQSSNFQVRDLAKATTEKVNGDLISGKATKNLNSNKIKTYSDIQEIGESIDKISKFI
jgi:hypothetical protein